MAQKGAHVAVVGHGIIGLTSALKLLEARHEVTIYFREDVPDLTTLALEAYWWPYRIYPEASVRVWAKATFEWYRRFIDQSYLGVSFKKHLRFCFDQDESNYAFELFSDWKEINPSDHGVSCKLAYEMQLPSIEPAIFLGHLKQLVAAKGASFVHAELSSLEELSSKHPIVINCSGLGARELANDQSVFPVRGQCVSVARPSTLPDATLIYKWENDFASIITRGARCVLGGTSQQGDSSRQPRLDDTNSIIKKCAAVNQLLGQPDVFEAKVGIRPGRPSVRLEVEKLASDLIVIHNYGHGGGGFTVAWGCAQEVAALLRSCLN